MSESGDSVPVLDDEIVLRRIPLIYTNPLSPISVKPEAFRPTDRDTNGISGFRERFVTGDQIFETVEESKRSRVGIVRMSVADLKSLKLTVVPDHIPEIPGHALILNSIRRITQVTKFTGKRYNID